MNKKIPTTIAISIVLITAILAGGFVCWRYFSFQEELSNQLNLFIPKETTQNETANWQAYTNEEYGFEECVANGYEIRETGWARDCITPSGELFTEEIKIKPLKDIVLCENDINLNKWEIKEIPVGGWGNSTLVMTNKETNEEKTLINNTFELRDYIGQEFKVASTLKNYGVIYFIGSSEKGDEIYFMLVYEYGGPLFGLNINSLDLREIKNAYFFASTVAFSPKGNKAIVGEKKYPESSLYLVCFENDSKNIIFTPTIGETLHEKLPELDDNIYIKWTDEKTIEYKIYEAKVTNYLETNFLIGIRSIEVPDCY